MSSGMFGLVFTTSATFTRPTDTNAYTSGDLVANNTSAGSVTPMTFTVLRCPGGGGVIRRMRLKKSTTTVTAAVFRLHLYTTSPTVANGDNSAWSTTESGYLGSFSPDMSGAAGRAFTDGVSMPALPDVGTDINVYVAETTTVFGLLEARGAYSPGNAEVFTAALEVWRN